MYVFISPHLIRLQAKLFQLLDILSCESLHSTPLAFNRGTYTPIAENEDPFNISEPAKESKPWLPIPGGECQFKCCHGCRPFSSYRTHLSLNGIVNGDIPATAISGFGFHLQRSKPVSLVKHVRNLGLRENPSLRPISRNGNENAEGSEEMKEIVKKGKQARLRRSRGTTNLGLAIFSAENVDDRIVKPSPLPLSPNQLARQGVAVIDFAAPNPNEIGLSPLLLGSLRPTIQRNVSGIPYPKPQPNSSRPISFHDTNSGTLRARRRHSLAALPSTSSTESLSINVARISANDTCPTLANTGPARTSSPSLVPGNDSNAGNALEKVGESGEVKVEGGIAVTEEGVQMEVADIVTGC